MKHYSDECLSKYLDEEEFESASGPVSLSSEESSEIKEHLERCAECRQAFEELRLLRATARQMAELEPSEAVWQRIRQQTIQSGLARRPMRLPRLAWFGLPALAAACFVLILVMGRGPGGGQAMVAPVMDESGSRSATLSVADTEQMMPVTSHMMAEVGDRSRSSSTCDNSGLRRGRQTSRVAESPAPAEDSVVVTSAGVKVMLRPGELLSEYIGGMERATDDARAALAENPGYPRVRQVFTSATTNRARALGQLTAGGD